MAFNWPTFRQRSLTAIVFVVVMLTGLLWNEWSFFILFSIIHFGCWFEYQRLIARIDPAYREITPFHRYGVMIAGWALCKYLAGDNLAIGEFSFKVMGYWIGLLFIFVLPLFEVLFARQLNLTNIKYSALGLLYISLSCALLIQLRSWSGFWPEGSRLATAGSILPLCIIFSMWINDTMAYIVGSLIGKTPFSKISPRKTWEGTIGGIMLCIVVLATLGYVVGLGWKHIAAIAGIAATAGTAGDLLESKLKRMAGLKDSGQIMPGHGGFLDRFDSLLVAVPFVWLYAWIFLPEVHANL